MAPKPHNQKQTQHQTQGRSVSFICFENITFRTYFVNSHTLSKIKLHPLLRKFISTLTANKEPGLPVITERSNAKPKKTQIALTLTENSCNTWEASVEKFKYSVVVL